MISMEIKRHADSDFCIPTGFTKLRVNQQMERAIRSRERLLGIAMAEMIHLHKPVCLILLFSSFHRMCANFLEGFFA